MSRRSIFAVLGLVLVAGAVGHYLNARVSFDVPDWLFAYHGEDPAAERRVLYYRDPSGLPYWSATPKQDAAGRDYLPVYEDKALSFDPAPPRLSASEPAKDQRKLLYYRNPMGAPDTSPVPKKDSMGMDYIPVYADELAEPGTVKVSLDKIQRSGVRTAKVEARPILRTVRAVGRVEHDETLLTIVALRTDGFIEELFVNKTGQHVRKGDPLFRVYSPQIQSAQTDLITPCARRKRWPLPTRNLMARCCACAISAFHKNGSMRCATAAQTREHSTGLHRPTAT